MSECICIIKAPLPKNEPWSHLRHCPKRAALVKART